MKPNRPKRADVWDPAAFAAVVRRHGPSAVARKLGAPVRTVQHWASGKHEPSATARARITETYGHHDARRLPQDATAIPDPGQGPPRSSNAPPGHASRTDGTAAPAPAGPTPHEDPRALAHRLVSRIETELAAAQGNEDYSPRERATLATAGTTALRLYSRLAGSLEVTQAALVRSAAWGRILRTFERVFSKHPEAAIALAEFVEALKEIGE